MNKLSSTDVKNILAEVPPLLRELNEKNAALQEKLAFYKKKERVEKIANEMQVKNLHPELSYEEKVNKLMQKDNLNVVEEAIGMQAPQVGFGLLDKEAGNTDNALLSFYEGLSN